MRCIERLALVGVALCAFLDCTAVAERLDLRDGRALHGEGIRFSDGQFQIPGRADNPVAREAVNDWWIHSAEADGEGDAPAPTLGSSRQALLAARERGRQFAEEFPGCKGVIMLDQGTFTLTEDHRHVYRYHFIGLMLSEDVLNWAHMQLGFSKGRSRQTVLAGRCLTREGTLKTLDAADIKVGIPGRGAVFFDPNARQLSAAIPGAEVGGVVEYIYEYEAYNPEDWRLFSPGFHFQMDVPCLQSRLEVEVPAEQKIYWWSENWDAAGTTFAAGAPGGEEAAGVSHYAWEKTRVPPVVEEPAMPHRSAVVPSVHVSLFEDWEYLDNWLGSLQKERMKATEAVKKQAEAIVGQRTVSAEIMAALYHWVQKNIRYVSIKSSLSSGWSGHPADETLKQGYGDCTDKSILLATMLRHFGFDAYPIVVRTNDRGDFDPEYPSLACNHAITLTELNGEELYLDSTTQDHRFPALRADSHGVLGHNFIEGTRNRIPVPDGKQANAKWSGETIHLRTDGLLECQTRNIYAGQYEAGLRGTWKQIPEAMKAPFMQQYLNSVAAGATLVDFSMADPQDLDVPFEMQFHYRVPRYVEKAGDVLVFQLPGREQQFNEMSVDDRRHGIVYTTTRWRERTVEVVFPDQWRVLAVPEDATVQSPYVRYAESYSRDGQTLRIKLTLEILRRDVPREECPGYLRDLRRIHALSRRPIYFERDNEKKGNKE